MKKTSLSISTRIQNKKVDEARNYFMEEINKNDLISRKHKNACTTLKYIEQ